MVRSKEGNGLRTLTLDPSKTLGGGGGHKDIKVNIFDTPCIPL